ncbi:fungal-specific transcription factor domain-containing protein [Aspergillus cavernicola]|uniref:Fungal-specific transcription factor domain-containing protein n=1 Tax=Aspergillus cavernicola TaxID=176166 RepID=A0ABR4IE99_9EURO
MSDPSSNRRGGRLRSACDLCQQKKIRCDDSKPDCETCRLASVRCTFTRRPPAPQKSTKERLAEANARILELEALVAAQSSLQRPAHGDGAGTLHHLPAGLLQDPHDINTTLAMFQSHIPFCGVGAAGSIESDLFRSAVCQQTGSHFDIDQFLQGLPKLFSLPNSRDSGNLISQKWPPKPLVQLRIHQFSKTGLYSVFPIANIVVLQTLLDENILDNQTQPTGVADLACLPAFADANPDAYLRAVLALLPRLIMEDASLRSLETIVILFVYIFPLGQPESGELLLAVAVRMLYILGGNRYSAAHQPEGEHLRALFWICYSIDKDLAVRFGRPPSIKDIDCDLRLPDNYISSWSDDQFFLRPLSPQQLLFPSDIRLAFIKSKIYTFLYSDHGRTQPEARRLQRVRELDEELSDLKSRFPDSFWPDLFATGEAPDYTFHDLSLRGVNLHLEYYYCLGKIHGASNAYDSSSPQGWSFLPSSAELFYQESRTMLLYVSRIRIFLNWHTFWIHAQFILTAIVSLFRHLITSPTAYTFGTDLQLLENVAETFSELDRESRATRRFAPFFFTACLTRKLIYLAKQAHQQAKNG